MLNVEVNKKSKVDFRIKAEFERAEMRVSRIVVNKAKIPLPAATCAALAALAGDGGACDSPPKVQIMQAEVSSATRVPAQVEE